MNISFNPGTLVPLDVMNITGLSNELLENQTKFNYDTGQLIQSFLSHLPKPICIIAHNGMRYDFPLLNAELFKANFNGMNDPEIFIMDSLVALKHIFSHPDQSHSKEDTNEPKKARIQTMDIPKSFSLPKLHESMFGKLPKISHGAHHDVDSLIRVCAYRASDFVNYANNNHKTLSDIKRMW